MTNAFCSSFYERHYLGAPMTVRHEEFRIRRFIGPQDISSLERLVTDVVTECYGHLLQNYRFDPDENWSSSWVADHRGEMVAVLLTAEDWVDDLWIGRHHRRHGLGSELLSIGESEIADRGYKSGKLRLVAENRSAKEFYIRHQWREVSKFPHEVHGFEMIQMVKDLK